MLIAISGSQGSGKSTIISELAARGHPTIQRKTSRSILQEWNISLDEANTNHDITIKFQEEITQRKFEDENMAAVDQSCNITFTERTHADVFAYAIDALGRENKYSDWLDEYYTTCLKYNQIYHRVYYIRAGRFHVEHDGTRGANKHYSRMMDISMLDITRQMIHPSKLVVIDTPDIQQRIDIIEQQSNLGWNG